MYNGWPRISTAVCLFSYLGLLSAQPDPCRTPPNAESSCSYSALNGNCTITINRLHPVAPPTIYARRGSRITVIVLNPSPFEDLSLDSKSDVANPALDAFSNGFSDLTTALTGFAIVSPEAAKAASPPNAAQFTIENPKPVPSAYESLLTDQKNLQDDLKRFTDSKDYSDALKGVSIALQQIHLVELPLPVSTCEVTSRELLRPWLNANDWRTTVLARLNAAIYDKQMATFKGGLQSIQDQIASLAPSLSPNQLAILNANQQQLGGALGTLSQIQLKFGALRDAVVVIPDSGYAPAFFITDLQRHDKNYETPTWNINYVNKLASVAKRVSGDKYVDPDSAVLAGLAEQPVKQLVTSVTVQFQPDPRFELSSGFLVPVTPYHSYSAAQSQSATGPVVQESKTYTVVPDASFNFLIGKEQILGKQRLAGFLTGAVGYTPASSSVAFGVGPSFSWRSMVLNALADFGRDARLAGGWTVNAPLGTATAPMTTNVWDVKFAVGISVRIPLSTAPNP